eukprot:336842_1
MGFGSKIIINIFNVFEFDVVGLFLLRVLLREINECALPCDCRLILGVGNKRFNVCEFGLADGLSCCAVVFKLDDGDVNTSFNVRFGGFKYDGLLPVLFG